MTCYDLLSQLATSSPAASTHAVSHAHTAATPNSNAAAADDLALATVPLPTAAQLHHPADNKAIDMSLVGQPVPLTHRSQTASLIRCDAFSSEPRVTHFLAGSEPVRHAVPSSDDLAIKSDAASPAANELKLPRSLGTPVNFVRFAELQDVSKFEEGNFGVAYRAFWRDGAVVIKAPKSKPGPDEVNELLSFLDLPQHPNVLPLLGARLCPQGVLSY